MKKSNQKHKDFDKYLKKLEDNFLSDNSKSTYASNQKRFYEWLGENTANEDKLYDYLIYLVSQFKSFATIKTAYQSIKRGIEITNNVKFSRLMTGIRNTYAKDGIFPSGAIPVFKKDLHKMIDKIEVNCKNNSLKTRNIAILLVLWWGAFRVSELVNLKVSDIKILKGRGIRILVNNAKNDHDKKGQFKALFSKRKYCPVKALKQWLELLESKDSFLFRTVNKSGSISSKGLESKAVYNLIKSLDKKYSPHSFRAGFISTAAENGANFSQIALQSGHKTLQMILHYTRSIDVFENNAAKKL